MQSTPYLKFTPSLKIAYGITLGIVVLWFLFWLISYSWGNIGWTGSNIFSFFLVNLPFIFFISTIPLAIFVTIFLTKGGGFNYFKRWNAGKKLYLSALAIIGGYIFVLFTPNTSSRFQHFPKHYDFYYTYFGLVLIAIGFVSFIIYKKS